ncbi:glycosyltransferase family 2 protein [Microbulbifer hydrolyticus]|uniref:Glycosyltransferase n=1 Tax=Microbulbifer hydrolyticus TaxID=48074 RepID=A0A6P1TA76_9GAMM|nr:glycosyltransferase family 2 protein [Microbulbifer hydrolyticus]MBB5213271.1 glycosyltransferase involved in cell wall biosynthesis [Microbulbifer hydrolyticus]QHQ38563.1 glycosyltransferase [Microbulbifer hydrolyticus]
MESLTEQAVPTLAIVVPCYNEEDVIADTTAELLATLDELAARDRIGADSKIYYVDDGSRDATWPMLQKLASDNKRIVAVALSCNRGHQNALYAGLSQTSEDMVVSIDADLQDGPDNIAAMIDAFREGHEVVFGVRKKRDTDTWFKRMTAEGYYRLMQALGVDLVFNHADFRLMSRRAVDTLLQYPETNLFLRGMVRELGFSSTTVCYARRPRLAGESKYPLRRMLSLAWKGVTAFSIAPLRAITLLGLIAGGIALGLIVWVLIVKLLSNSVVPGWASIMVPVLFIGSVQLLCLGVIGEYLGKIYEEVKRRPRFHLREVVGGEARGHEDARTHHSPLEISTVQVRSPRGCVKDSLE